jgi:hypothetical protein
MSFLRSRRRPAATVVAAATARLQKNLVKRRTSFLPTLWAVAELESDGPVPRPARARRAA